MARCHRELIEQATAVSPRHLGEVLALGARVVAHTAAEGELFALNRLLEEVVLVQLVAEHRCIAEDLRFLTGLVDSNPDSPDIQALSSALLTRIRQLLAREDRGFYQPLLRLLASPSGSAGSPSST